MLKFWTIIFIFLKFNFSKYGTNSLELISYDQLNKLIEQLKNSNNMRDIMRINNVFDLYQKIPRPNCDQQNTQQCDSYLIEIADFTKGENYVKKLPTILLIAGFHGNEVVGTNAFYYFLKSFNKHYLKNNYYNNLVKNVRILILPTANVNGFANLHREEYINGQSYDPNRDFPFNIQQESDKCFKTSTSMIIDSIYRSNLIVGAFTFHGGDNSISYPWGNFAHENQPLTGDNIAFDQVVRKFTQIAGGNNQLGIEPYGTGNLQSTVYDVYGGFEDWAYGASWDTKNVPKNCSLHDDFSNYFNSNDINYDSQSNRSFIYLIEAGYQKIPSQGTLGNELSIYQPGNKKSIYGHIARNVRLSLSFAEMMNPYLTIISISYNQDLQLVLELRGCLTLDQFTIDNIQNLQNEIKQSKKSSNSNTILITALIKNPNDDLSQLSFSYSCDQSWKTQYQHQEHQAHLVKMRVEDNYNVEYKGYSIKSQKKMQSHLLNINLNKIKDATIQQVQQNVNNLIYTNVLQGITADNNIIKMSIDNTNKVVSDLRHSKVTVHSLTSKKIQPRHLMLLQEDQEMSKQNFYDLVGTQFTVQDNDDQKQKTGYFKIDDDSSLFIPQNGLIIKKIMDIGAYVIEIIPKELNKLEFNLRFNGQQPKSLSVGNISFNLPKTLIKEKSYNLLIKEHQIEMEDLNDFRLLGQTIKLYDENGEKILEEYLLQRNTYKENYNQNFFGITRDFKQKKNINDSFYFKYSHFIFASFIMMILLTALTIIFVQRKKQMRLRDIEQKVLNELEIIDN